MGIFSSIGKAVKGLVKGVTGGDLLGVGGSLLGGAMDNDAQAKANAQNAAFQREFAQNAIRWKVADANAAGINPLYALGAPASMPSPSYVGETGMGQALASAGQNIGRAINATRSTDERAAALALENASLQNDLLRAQITTIHRANNPGFPLGARAIDGQAQTPSREGGTIPDVGFVETEQGGLAPIYSDAVKQRVEDSILPEVEWYLRNRLNPAALLFGTGKAPREGWHWSPFKQQWLPPTKGDRRSGSYRGLPGR